MSNQLFFYILKRLMIMIPTLFAIAVICFLVLNLAPGRPGQQAEAQQSSSSEDARQQQRIFKEFFNYDKPIFFNDYSSVTTEEVREKLEVLLGRKKGYSTKEIIDFSYEIEDYGEYIVPQLMELLSESEKDEDMTALLLKQLSINGRLRNLFLGRESDIPPEILQRQKVIGEHNQRITRWKPGIVPTLEEKALVLSLEVGGVTALGSLSELSPIWGPSTLSMHRLSGAVAQTRAFEKPVLKSLWESWYAENEARFQLSQWDKIHRFFFDTRFAKYMSNLMHGDFGFTRKKEPVLPEILKRLKYSFVLSFWAILLTYLLSIPIGVYSAVRQHSIGDQIITVVLFILYSLPTFFVGMLIVQYIPSGQPFYTSGFETSDLVNPYMTSGEKLWDIVLHLVFPILALTYGGLAALSRYARTGLLDVIRADYIRTARAKGLSEPVVIVKHAMRNGMIPILTILGTLLPVLFGGSIVIESIFQIPGIGLYMLEAITNKDYSVIMAVLLISAVMTLIGLLISDISYALVDPRITFD